MRHEVPNKSTGKYSYTFKFMNIIMFTSEYLNINLSTNVF